jgi:hypothetical protein
MRYVHWQRQPGENSLSKGEYKRVIGRENHSNTNPQYTQYTLLPQKRIKTKKKKKKKNSLSFDAFTSFFLSIVFAHTFVANKRLFL